MGRVPGGRRHRGPMRRSAAWLPGACGHGPQPPPGPLPRAVLGGGLVLPTLSFPHLQSLSSCSGSPRGWEAGSGLLPVPVHLAACLGLWGGVETEPVGCAQWACCLGSPWWPGATGWPALEQRPRSECGALAPLPLQPTFVWTQCWWPRTEL